MKWPCPRSSRGSSKRVTGWPMPYFAIGCSSARREVDKLPYHRGCLQGCEALVDVGKLDVAGDHVVQLQLTLHIEFEQARHIDAEPVAAHRGALDLAITQEVRAVQFDLGAKRNHADDGRGATWPQHAERLFGGCLGADRLE